MKLLTTLALLSIALTGISASPLSGRILGGTDAVAGQFPYIVSLRTLLLNHFCGGSIVNERWVLTAAHCMIGRDEDSVNIVAGSHIMSAGGFVFRSSRVFTHPSFSFAIMANDLSLIMVTTPFFWTDNIQPLALGNIEVGGGVMATIAGWGWTTNPGTSADILQWQSSGTLTTADCRTRHTVAQRAFIHVNTVCTFTGFAQGMCMGDTGGPVVIGNTVVGIKSWSVQCGLVPDVHVRISSHRDWIISLTEAPIHELP